MSSSQKWRVDAFNVSDMVTGLRASAKEKAKEGAGEIADGDGEEGLRKTGGAKAKDGMRKTAGKGGSRKGVAYVPDEEASAFVVFRRYDLDGSGGISAEELRALLKDHRDAVQLSEQDAELAVNLLSKGGSSEISYQDFASWWQTDDRLSQLQWTPGDVATLRELRSEFCKFDKDGSGTISKNEFSALHARLLEQGYNIPAKIEECLAAMLDGKAASKGVSFYDWVTYMRALGFSKAAPAAPRENLLARQESAARVFLRHDKDVSGHLDAAEMKALLKTMGSDLSLEECKLAVKLMAANGDEITLLEFKNWFEREDRFRVLQWDGRELARLKKFQDLFDRFDEDSSGQLQGEEIAQLHGELVRNRFNVPPLEAWISEVDSDGNGKISFGELTQFFRIRRIFFEDE